MSTELARPPYPARLEAAPPERLSRWLWLVKWLLIIPHVIVLVFLWIAFLVLSVIAFFAILLTARYPRGIFNFNVGVLRWAWRVGYYSASAFATDAYPPFTLGEAAGYPATFTVEYPERLSRGLVLVKWWLLAIPHYIVLALLLGPQVGYTVEDQTRYQTHIGLIGVLALVAVVVLLFAGHYPRGVYDLIVGLNRWVYRVTAYAGLMTDVYPPFRLDMGPTEPTTPPPS
jgi:hypothetical protein